MSVLGNILWFVCGGLLSGLAWVLSGCLWCITIIGIPIGLLANIVWLIVSGIPMAVGNAAIGVVCCITIIGIPFGRQFFKIAKLALLPFGATVR